MNQAQAVAVMKILGAVAGGVICGPLGVPLGKEGVGILAQAGKGLIDSVGSILANFATDDLKRLGDSIILKDKWQNHDLQKCLAHAFEKTLRDEIRRLSAKGLEKQCEHRLAGLADYFKNSVKNLSELEVLFETNGADADKLVNFDNIFYNKFDEADQAIKVWEYCEIVFSRCKVGWKWSPRSSDLESLRDELKGVFPYKLITNINQTFKQDDFKEAWIAFQREILMRMFNGINSLGYIFKDEFEKFSMKQKGDYDRLERLLMELNDKKLHELSENMYEVLLENSEETVQKISKTITETSSADKKAYGKMLDSAADRIVREIGSIKQVYLEQNAVIAKDQKNIENNFIEINKLYLAAKGEPSIDECIDYYKGYPVDWPLVRGGRTAHRKDTERAFDHLKNGKFRAVIITGAGGEGKSTILMQLGLMLLDEGYKVLYSENTYGSEIKSIFEENNQPLAIVIDNAEQLRNLTSVLNMGKVWEYPVKLVMASRKNEWVNSKSFKELNSFSRYLKEIEVKKIVRDEAEQIAKLLMTSGIVSSDDLAYSTECLLNESNGFLLAAMITTTHGETLEKILYDVLYKISSFENSREILEVLGIVVTIETLSSRSSEKIVCSTRLFKKAVEESGLPLGRITSSLIGEVSLQTMMDKVQTRHEKISEILYNLLFDMENPFSLDERSIVEKIIQIVGEITYDNFHLPEARLLWLLPSYYYKNMGYVLGQELFKMARESNPMFYVTWLKWADLEIDRGNIGDVKTQNSARAILKDGCMRFKRDFQLWLKWAQTEVSYNNIGDYDTEDTARCVYRNGAFENYKSFQLWMEWAKLEESQGKTGDIWTENTPRWILYRCLEGNDTNIELYLAWVELEKRLGNIGNISTDYSAIWIASKGAPLTKDVKLYVAWASMEFERGVIGDFETKNSARWIISQGLKCGQNEQSLWCLWAEIEKSQGNIGSAETKNSALWIISKGLEANKKEESLWRLWAEIEREQENIGDIETKGSARWIISQGLEANNYNTLLWGMWAQIEMEQKNIGDTETKGTALWVISQGLKYNPKNKFLWTTWAQIEKERGNIGSIEKPGSACWIISQGLKNRPKDMDLLKFLEECN